MGRTTRRGTYQMLWDCPSCGSSKLLGIDHRHCPHCGAAQEENLRYFPSKGDRVPTVFRGSTPDWECEHCGTPCAAADGFCMGCGAPRGDAASVHVRASLSAGESENGAQAKREWNARRQRARAERSAPQRHASWFQSLRDYLRYHRKGVSVVAIAMAILGLIWFLCTDKEVQMVVHDHSWARTIPVERYSTIQENDWCSRTPGGARVYSRQSEVHHYDEIPDGEDCRDIPESCSESCSNIDNGNGSFSEVCTQTCTPSRQECTTRYREEPVYADKCYYEIDHWIQVHAAKSAGQSRSPEPSWPDNPSVSECASERVGCERLGTRTGTYWVHFRSEEGGLHQCGFPQAEWAQIDPGDHWLGGVSRIGEELDCETLERVGATR